MVSIKSTILASVSVMAVAAPAAAQTEIEFWHAFTGANGDRLAAQAQLFNESQDAYTVTAKNACGTGAHSGPLFVSDGAKPAAPLCL